MGFDSRIQWCHATFNPWVGCTKVGPGCDHCYAESWSKGAGSPELWQGSRRRTTPANWKTPLKWNRWADERGIRYRVFCASLADVFDNTVDPQWRADLWDVILATPNLEWLLLTKRIGNALGMFPAAVALLPNVWLGITVVNQDEADRDIPKLLRLDMRGPRWLSIEPMLGPIDLSYPKSLFPDGPRTCCDGRECGCMGQPIDPRVLHGINWVVVGGESGGRARPMHPDWARSVRDQCASAGVPYFFKQWGDWAPGESAKAPATRTERTATLFDDRWEFSTLTPRQSEELHCDDAPDLFRLGTKQSGHHLDGRVHQEFPR